MVTQGVECRSGRVYIRNGCSNAPMTKILLVEDSKFLRLATERALVRVGYEVSSAADGDEALRLAREKLPDLILLDMLLPKMSGLEVLGALKKDPKTSAIPVVVLTGMSQKNAARLEGDGAFGFLEKADLELDKGSGKLLTAVAEILKKLPSIRERATTA
jgi:two-component system, cell cycle response regulator DivK